jgi:ABC-2 type transport system ATP-binding protein
MESEILTVEGLYKQYPHFTLDHVSFALREGRIIGFIGRNGAGKSTTLKSLLKLVHPDGGTIRFWGREFSEDENGIKQKIGYVAGSFDCYPHKKLAAITAVNRRFYQDWDEEVYRACMERFRLLEDKTPAELSEGMKVKYALTLALSHHAKLLILDEPTSGLDPVSREDLLEVFLSLAREEGVTILFSTHITSDLDKCADDILYLQSGKLIADSTLDEFVQSWRLVRTAEKPAELTHIRANRSGWTGLIRSGETAPAGAVLEAADLEAIMVHLEKEN